MLTIRRAHERGHANHGWLNTYHTFSFADYYDPRHMGWGNLRVINEDRVAPGKGFGTHSHRDMEIISYVISGALEHQDSMGNKATILPHEIQRMSAGSGVRHSEYNPRANEPVHFLQIWIQPDQQNITPGYEQKTFTPQDKRGILKLVASGHGEADAVRIHADARVYAGLFDGAEQATLPLNPERKALVHIVQGSASINGQPLNASDAALFNGETQLCITDGQQAEVLVFDLRA